MSILRPKPRPPLALTLLQIDDRLSALSANKIAAELTGDAERRTVVMHRIDVLLELRKKQTDRSGDRTSPTVPTYPGGARGREADAQTANRAGSESAERRDIA